MLYWSVGKRIREDVLGGERAAYGAQVISQLSAQLAERFGRGWSRQSLERMVRFAAWIPETEICSSLMSKLTWTHVVELLAVPGQPHRNFYAVSAARGRWSVRTLRERIASRLYERTLAAAGSIEALDVNIAGLANSGTVPESTAVFRDPYVLDFLGLPSEHSEADLESAILDEMQRVLLELGAGFAFVERQKRMPVDGRDYRLDLLMYHITMRCYVAIELKTRSLEPGDHGQMTLYLRWLAAHQHHEGDGAPIGLILCTEKGPEQVALLGLDDGEIRAARYLVDSVRAGLDRVLAESGPSGTDAGGVRGT